MPATTRRRLTQQLALAVAMQGVFSCVGPLMSSGLALAAASPGTDTGSSLPDLALKGQNLLAAGDISSAVDALRQAVALDGENDFVLGLLGRALHSLGNDREAIPFFRKAAALNPDDTYSRMMADVLSQKPLSHGLQGASQVIPRVVQSPAMADLEQAAQQEEERMREWLNSQKQAVSGYRIRRLVLDAGHGGFDSGAVGLSGLKEKDVNLALVRRCGDILAQQAPHLRLFYTRTDDYYVPLSARTAVANQYSADLFVSFHCNASENRSAQGVETYFCSENASSKEAQRVAQFENSVLKYDDQQHATGSVDIEDLLFRFERRRYWQAGDTIASLMQQSMATQLPLNDRGVHSADFYVLRKARMPSILLETGFLSNVQEESMLSDSLQQHRIASTVAKSIIRLSGGGGSL